MELVHCNQVSTGTEPPDTAAVGKPTTGRNTAVQPCRRQQDLRSSIFAANARQNAPSQQSVCILMRWRHVSG
jgi:hypothetical protein